MRNFALEKSDLPAEYKEEFEKSVGFLQEFADSLPGATFLVNLSLDDDPEERFRGMIFQKGAIIGQQPLVSVGAPDPDTLLAKVQELWEKYKGMMEEVRVTTMAVFIMKQMSEQGYCTRTDLIGGHFSEAEIDALQAKALDKAAHLAKPGSFKIS